MYRSCRKKSNVFHLQRIPYFILGLLFTINGFTQQKVIQFDHLSAKEGLSQNNALITFQDSKGFIWIGTEDGLNMYNGYECIIFRNNPQDSSSLSSNFIRTIVEDKDGNLWIGTQDGLNVYHRETNKFVRMMQDINDPSSLATIVNNGIQRLYHDSKNRVWILTEQGINIYDIKTSTMNLMVHDSTNRNSLSSNYTRYILEDTEGRFWIATYSGLNLYDESKKQFKVYTHDPGNPTTLSSNRIQYVFQDSKKRLWVGTFDNGLNLMDMKNGIFKRFVYDPTDPNSLPNNLVNCIAEGLDGTIWIGTSGGLCRYHDEDENFTTIQRQIDNDLGISSMDITHVFFDINGCMWVSTRFGGINTYDEGKNKFLHYKNIKTDPSSLRGENVTSFIEDKLGNVWVGVDGGGLNYFNRQTGKFSHIIFSPNNPSGLTNDKILSLCMDSYGMLWIGMWAGGINVYNPTTGTFKHYLNDPYDNTSLSDNNIFYIYEDKQKDLWIGTWGSGLCKYNRETDDFSRYENRTNDPTSISTSGCVMILEDYLNNLWIASEGAGINLFDRKKNIFIHYDNKTDNGLSNMSVYSIFEDSKKRLWFGTNGGGLNLFNRKKQHFTSYRMADGLPNDVIFGILEDDDGNLWLSTNEGLCRFSPDSITFKNYNVSDGLQGSQFGRWAFKELSTGEFLFGGVNGFNMFKPNEVKENKYIPPVYITGFKLFNEDVPIGEKSILKKNIILTDEIVLKYNQNVITFEFTALNYRQSGKNKYKYILEGFHEDWIDAKNERKVSFTNLDPGTYVFRVKASNNDGVWNEEGVALKIVIVPPFWRTWWFYALIIIVVVISIYYFIRRRESELQRDKALLQSNLDEGKKAVEQQKIEIENQRLAILQKDKEGEIQKWFNAGLAKFSNLISKNKDITETLAGVLITELVEFLGAQLGAIFILIEDEKDKYLKLAGTYAMDDQKTEDRKILIGEGYVGTCFEEKKVLVIDNLPEGYAKLNSGLGEAVVKHSALIPIRLDELAFGVIEIMSFEKLEDYKIEFVEKLGETVSATLATTIANDKTRVMYEQIKQKTEEMAAQEEELRQNLEEMTATQEEMERRQKKYKKMAEEFAVKEKQLTEEIQNLKKEAGKRKK